MRLHPQVDAPSHIVCKLYACGVTPGAYGGCGGALTSLICRKISTACERRCRSSWPTSSASALHHTSSERGGGQRVRVGLARGSRRSGWRLIEVELK